MSRVTNAILHMGVLDEEEGPRLIREVNKFFDHCAGFVLVDSPRLPEGWYGGSKMLECSLAIGAFNYLNLPNLVEHLRKIEWPFDQVGCVQLIVKEQDDDRFRTIDI